MNQSVKVVVFGVQMAPKPGALQVTFAERDERGALREVGALLFPSDWGLQPGQTVNLFVEVLP